MRKKPIYLSGTEKAPVYERIRQILESARSSVARTVNTTQVVANWLIGREIVEEEQKGQRRAGYGERLIRDLSVRLSSEYGAGYNLANLKFFRKFYLEYPKLFSAAKGYAVRSQSEASEESTNGEIHPAVPSLSSGSFVSIGDLRNIISQKGYALRSETWEPGQLNPNLSWTHYRTLLRVEKTGARAFYEIEGIRNNWSARGKRD